MATAEQIKRAERNGKAAITRQKKRFSHDKNIVRGFEAVEVVAFKTVYPSFKDKLEALQTLYCQAYAFEYRLPGKQAHIPGSWYWMGIRQGISILRGYYIRYDVLSYTDYVKDSHKDSWTEIK